MRRPAVAVAALTLFLIVGCGSSEDFGWSDVGSLEPPSPEPVAVGVLAAADRPLVVTTRLADQAADLTVDPVAPGAVLLPSGPVYDPAPVQLATATPTVGPLNAASPTAVPTPPAPLADATTPFVATVTLSMDPAPVELGALEVLAPYDGLVVDAAGLTVDSATLVEGQLQVAVEDLGQDEVFVSNPVPTRAWTFEKRTGSGLASGQYGISGGRVVFHDKLYFRGVRSYGAKDKLFVYDPQAGTFRMLTNQRGNSGNDGFSTGVAYGDSFVFSIRHATGNRRKLHRYRDDPESLNKVVDLAPVDVSEEPGNFRQLTDALYFTARVNADGDVKLFRYVEDAAGTPVEVRQITDLRAGNTDGIQAPVVWGDRLAFTALNDLGARKVFVFDPDAYTITEVSNTSGDRALSDEAGALVAHGPYLAFRALDGNAQSRLFVVDTTLAEVRQVTELVPGGSDDPQGLTVVGDQLLFAANAAPGVAKLFRYDVDTDVLAQVFDLAGPSVSDAPASIVALGSLAVLTADDGSGDRTLYAYDLEAGALRRIADTWAAGSDEATPLAVWNDLLFFRAQVADGASKLCVFDGRTAARIADVSGDSAVDDAPAPAGRVGDAFLFEASEGGNEAIFALR